MTKIKILIADDHPIVREGLKQIISRATDLEIISEAYDGFDVIEKVNQLEFDIAVLDISMPKKDGLEVLKEIKILKPNLPVLMLSVFPEDQIAIRTYKAGASGYMNKDAAPKELVNAIRKITSGGKYISSVLAEKLISGFSDKTEAMPHDTLSDREFQVLRMIASAKNTDEIAEELFISIKTVRTYRERILEKLHLKNDVEIAKYAIKWSLMNNEV